jgi:23S rRNA (cytidine1920-2'-O)/16S rRNA (cytidine1409-2'-O)-methyltransferase
MRIDVALVQKGIAKSRTQAQEFIRNNAVLINNVPCKKASEKVEETDVLTFVGEKPTYVGRGGYKLEAAINLFSIDVCGKICLDIGASTGGFTDCMLQNGAKLVYAVDTGTDQLDEQLRHDTRVVSLEQTDIRDCKDKIPQKADFAAADVSFISLKKIIPFIPPLLKSDANVLLLVKPQFEAGKRYLGKNGVIKDEKLRLTIVQDIIDFAKNHDFRFINQSPCPIRGKDGNQEYLLYLKLGG